MHQGDNSPLKLALNYRIAGDNALKASYERQIALCRLKRSQITVVPLRIIAQFTSLLVGVQQIAVIRV